MSMTLLQKEKIHLCKWVFAQNANGTLFMRGGGPIKLRYITPVRFRRRRIYYNMLITHYPPRCAATFRLKSNIESTNPLAAAVFPKT